MRETSAQRLLLHTYTEREELHVPREPWMDVALCASAPDPDVFFRDDGDSVKQARDVCVMCPVSAACLRYAFDHQESHGMWGGLTAKQRRNIGEPSVWDAREREARRRTRRVLRVCAGGCGRITRGAKTHMEDAPGTVCRYKCGMCYGCYKRHQTAAA